VSEFLLRALSLADAAFTEAEESYRWALAVVQRCLGPDDPEAATLHRRWADLECLRGRTAEAESHVRQAVAIRTAALGAGHPDVAIDVVALGSLLVLQNRLDEAEALLRRARITLEAVFGPESSEAVLVARELTLLYEARGDTP